MAEITKAEFEKLYRSKTNKELAEMFGCTRQTIVNMANRLGIKQKGKGNHQAHLNNKPKIKIIG